MRALTAMEPIKISVLCWSKLLVNRYRSNIGFTPKNIKIKKDKEKVVAKNRPKFPKFELPKKKNNIRTKISIKKKIVNAT